MRDYFYILDAQRHVVSVADASTWRDWYGGHSAERKVAEEEVGDASVTTTFLGLNLADDAGDPPLVFETLALGGRMSHLIQRCSTWEQAEAMHREMVDRVKAAA